MPTGSDNRVIELWMLRLYVAGGTLKSLRAQANLRSICEEHLSGRYELQVIDVLESPESAEQDGIMAIPTLVRKIPVPVRKIVGDLSNTERVLEGLDIARRAA
jgi:circadian clock protein KaiB